MIFPFASCLPTERKMEGANAKLFTFYGHYKHDSSPVFLQCTLFFKGGTFFFQTVMVSQVILSLKSVKNQSICQYDIMNINFLIGCYGNRLKCCLISQQIREQVIYVRSYIKREGKVQRLRTWTLEADCLGSNPDPTSYSCVMLNKVLKCFYASVSSPVKWEQQQYLPHRVLKLE